ncbi:MAG: Nif3-like dinuclear metal center hexameric protein [Dysgonamonadaceae bacterium]|jgi:dinuclear metal center YbgI/SA1388 family protein|nr:Nif3-like dinuclear metal center hexameric protein [Dysgonamonadaceae bacterium]
MKISEIISELERTAPLFLQEDFDNSGIQTGNLHTEATGVLVCLDVTEAVLYEAVDLGCNLIISHHPLIFRPLKKVTDGSYIERCVKIACKYDLTVYSCHTNLDNAAEGVNHLIAKKLGLQNIRILSPKKNDLFKLSVFVPADHAKAVRDALFAAGAGCIGNYDSCSFNTEGQGTFRANEDANPFIGERGKLYTGQEIRIETIIPKGRQRAAIRALLDTHPYEEPAFDLYPLANEWSSVGSGVVGELPVAENETVFLRKIKSMFNSEALKHSPLTGKKIHRVALCGGSGAFLIRDAIAAGAEIFITGEAKYNDFYDVENRILLAVAGHYETEVCTKQLFYDVILKKNATFAVHYSKVDSNPVNYM